MDDFDCEFPDNREMILSSLLVDEIENENFDGVMRLLLQRKANPNLLLPNRGITPMHVLAGFENECFSIDVLELAIKKANGDPNIRSNDGLTPVHLAAMWGKCLVLEVLLNSGGDPYLNEFKFSLNAEDLALKEHQWKTHAILATFTMFNENEDDFEYYLNHSLHSSDKSLNPNKSKPIPLQDYNDSISESSKENPNNVKSINQLYSNTKETQTAPNDFVNIDEDSLQSYVDCENLSKQCKINRNKKFSRYFTESFSKLRDFFKRPILSKFGSCEGPKFTCKKNSSKMSL